MRRSPEFYGADAAAQRALMRDIQSYQHVVTDLRNALFLRHVALNVRYVTPLFDIVSRSERIDLDGAVSLITPPRSWPVARLSTDARRTSRGLERNFAFTSEQIAERHRYAGIVVHRGGGGDVLGTRIVGSSIELTVVRGALMLDTFHGFGRLHIKGPVPDTLAVAMSGRPISQLVEHPWLIDPNWKVISVGANRSGLTDVIFETGQAPWRLKSASEIEKKAIAC